MAAPTYISLFAGAGGLDLSIRLALPDARCVCFVEREIPAAAILAARMRDGSLHEAPIWSDVRTFGGAEWRGLVDGIIGGFPCTDLSVAGKQEGIHGEHSGLFFEYVRIVREVQPGWVYIENVPPVLAFPAGGTVLGEFAKLGFNAEWGIIRASDVGAPHQRKRAFILAYRGCQHEHIRQWLIRGESSGSIRELADAQCARWASARNFDAGGELEAGCGIVDDTGHSGWRPDDEPSGDCGEGPDRWREAASGAGESGLPLFPPGPGDTDAWQRILAERPDLAPAVESGVRGLANGLASRVDRLRAGGNGVVALQGAVAFRLLARRAGLI